jgi:eukaryotic-like serine/threonine-protein kinase
LVQGGTLFAGSADRKVHAFRVGASGTAWTYSTGGPVYCTPVLVNGNVCIGSDDHYVYGINAGTGKRTWSYRTGGPVRSGLTSSGETASDYIFAGGGDGNLYAFGIDGQFSWKFAASGPVTAGPVYAEGGVFIGDSKGNFIRVPYVGPPQSWEKSFGGVVNGTPAVAGDVLYLGSAGSVIYSTNVYVGNPYWHYPTSGPVNAGLATDGVTLYAGDDDGYLYAIDIASISLRWRYRVGAAIRSQILLAANGVVYFGSQDHHVYALRA